MGDKVWKGMDLTVDGSKSGATHIRCKSAYTPALMLEYAGETKSGARDNEPEWYIEKLIYTPVLMLDEILVAQNKASAGCTSVSINTDANELTITALNGDFSEALTDDTVTLTVLDGTSKTISATFIKISPTVIEINLTKYPQAVITDGTYTILESDLLLTFNQKANKPYDKRRWNHRERYIYA